MHMGALSVSDELREALERLRRLEDALLAMDWDTAADRNQVLTAVEAPAQTPAAEGEEPQDYAALRSAFDLACGQIEADAHAIERLKRALRVAAHKPHDQAGEPDPESGFPVCSVCGAIQTQAPAADAGLDVVALLRRLGKPEQLPQTYTVQGPDGRVSAYPPAERRHYYRYLVGEEDVQAIEAATREEPERG